MSTKDGLRTTVGPTFASADGQRQYFGDVSSIVDAAMVRRAHDVGLAVNVWTVDDAQRMAALIEMGVDGICTNVPDVARSVVDG